ncbi:MAG: V-type ATP synthase subunit I [Eubacteriales bacterium]|nr:V-type ATP synthase subunit I [Eubacteriales bacterium]
MAIVKMKRLRLLGMREDKSRLLSILQRLGCVELTELDEEFPQQEVIENSEYESLSLLLPRVRRAIERLKKYDQEKAPAYGQYRKVSSTEAEKILKNEHEFINILNAMDAADLRISEIGAQLLRIQAHRKEYAPWETLTHTPEDFQKSDSCVFICGSVPTRNLAQLEQEFAEISAGFDIVNTSSDNTYIVAAIYRQDEETGLQALERSGFVRQSFSSLGNLSPKEYLNSLDEQEKALEQERATLNASFENFGKDLPRLKSFHDIIMLKFARAEASNKTYNTGSTFFMEGWVPEEDSQKLSEELLSVAPYTVIDLQDPKEDEEPSIKLKNNRFVTAFEPVVEGFSLPSYRGIDPTPVMSAFYMILFAVMLSDAGYGLLMTLALFLFIKIKKIPVRNAKMLYLLIFCGAATVAVGLWFNTAFGISPLPKYSTLFPLDAVNDPLPVMGICLLIGIIHLFAGVFTAAYMDIKRGDWVGAISDQISWLVLLVGLGFLMVPSLKEIGKIMAIVSVVIILLMTGRDKRNPFKRIMSGLGALYGITSWVSDILSYMRLFGMGLATGVIGMVFNILIGMIWNAGFIGKPIAIVLFIVCHLFNLGINALGAYVHACRLQYIEFFGKFYEDGGRPFKPLNMQTRYVSIQSK